MSKRIYVVTAVVLLALVAGTMSASLQQPSSSVEDDNEIDQTKIGRSNSKISMLEMTKALLKEQAARAVTNSEVLTLNLTNLVIMLVIKAIIFGFGFVGSFGRRSSESSFPTTLLNQTDLMMTMSYALGSTTHDYGCLYRMACEEPQAAHQYMTASKMLLKGAKLFKNSIGYNEDYEDIIYGLQEAIEYRNSGGVCHEQYQCKPMQ